MKIKGLRFCPKCKSTNIRKEFNIFLIFGAPQKWRCQDCGFTGYLFPEKLKKRERKK